MKPAYNRAGALEKVEFDGTDFVEHIAYNAKGQRLLIAFGNGIMTRYAYDNQTFRLKRIRSETFDRDPGTWEFESAGSVKQDTAYGYDLSGNIVASHERTTGCGVGGSNALDRSFQYDALYRLIKATGRENAPTITPIWDDSYRSNDSVTTTAYTQNYTYDKMGNILKLQHQGNNNFTRVFNPDINGDPPEDYGNNNLLNELKVGGTTYDFLYDDNGNLKQQNTERFYEWDYVDRMRSFYIDDGSTITRYAHYLYDSGGNRIKKIVRNDGGSYDSITYIDGIYEYRTDGTDEQALSHIMDDKSRIAMVREGDDFGDTKPPTKYVLEDHLGGSVMELKTDGGDIEKEEYYPFGETSYASYQLKRYKYNGKEKDEESGLYYYGARYYAAWMCRFISVDPKTREKPNFTPYHYTSNNPVNRIDPDGKKDKGGGGGKGGGSEGKGGEAKSDGGKGDKADNVTKEPGGEAEFKEALKGAEAAVLEGKDVHIVTETDPSGNTKAGINIEGQEPRVFQWEGGDPPMAEGPKISTDPADLEVPKMAEPAEPVPKQPAEKITSVEPDLQPTPNNLEIPSSPALSVVCSPA